VVWEIPCFSASPRVDQCVLGWRRLQRLDRDRLDHVVADTAGRARAGGVDQPVEAVRGEAVPPLRHRRRMGTELGGDVAVGAARTGGTPHSSM
jgi:hypothetical protein